VSRLLNRRDARPAASVSTAHTLLFIVAHVLQEDTVVEPRVSPKVTIDLEAGLTPGRFALLLGLLIFAAFPQILLGLQTFVVRDFGFFSYPAAFYQRECFWRGELPLWNPYNHCGVPFLAQWNTMQLYPPSLIYLLLPLAWSLPFFCLLHQFWAGLGMYYLARRWTGSLLAASVAGLIFAFNGFTLNLLMWPSHIATLSWMPWVIAAVETGWERGGRFLGMAALIGGLQMLAGAPETIFLTWSICAVLWLAHLVKLWRVGQASRRRVHRASPPGDTPKHDLATGEMEPALSGAVLRSFWRFPAMVILVACVAAAQLLPFLDLAAHSQRESGFADARWSMPARGWANFFVPMVFGNTVKQGMFFQHGQYWTSSYYLGIGTLVLAAIGLASWRQTRVWLLSSVGLLGLILATGDQTLLSRAARQLLPQLSMVTYPIKFVLLTVFVLPLLAGFGVASLEQAPARAARKRLLIAAAVIAATLGIVLLWAWRFPLPSDNTSAALRNGASRAAFLVCATLLLWGLFSESAFRRTTYRSIPHLLPLLLLVLFWLDLWTHEPQQNPGMPSWAYEPGLARKQLDLSPEPVLGASRVMSSPAVEKQFRGVVLPDVKANYLAKRLGYFADCNLLDAVPKVDGFFSLTPRECGELYSALYVSGVSCGEGLPDFLSVSHMTAPGDSIQWTTRKNSLPLATGGQRPVFLDDTNALLTLLSRRFNPRETVLLPLETKELFPAIGDQPVKVSVVTKQFTAQRVELEVETAAPALVVVGQTFYHQWRASVDGNPFPLLRANYAFQAVPVPTGRHRVQLRYEDHPFQAGLAVTALALAACLGLALKSGICRPLLRHSLSRH